MWTMSGKTTELRGAAVAALLCVCIVVCLLLSALAGKRIVGFCVASLACICDHYHLVSITLFVSRLNSILSLYKTVAPHLL